MGVIEWLMTAGGVVIALIGVTLALWQARSAKRQTDISDAALTLQRQEIDRNTARIAEMDGPRFRVESAGWRMLHEPFATVCVRQTSGRRRTSSGSRWRGRPYEV